jgi:hypothetical protein
MRKLFLAGIIFLNMFFVQGYSFKAQSNEAKIILLNRKNQATTRITDGDSLRIQLTLSQTVSSQETIQFTLGEMSLSAGSCVIPGGKTTCTTDSFPSLGWHWDPNGIAQTTRVVQAKNDNGELIAQSDTITVSPRPVVMVHGFVSNWQTWNSYLQAGGFLDSLGLKGFAVGDGQVPGVMNTGVITNPAGRTNTIAQKHGNPQRIYFERQKQNRRRNGRSACA